MIHHKDDNHGESRLSITWEGEHHQVPPVNGHNKPPVTPPVECLTVAPTTPPVECVTVTPLLDTCLVEMDDEDDAGGGDDAMLAVEAELLDSSSNEWEDDGGDQIINTHQPTYADLINMWNGKFTKIGAKILIRDLLLKESGCLGNRAPRAWQLASLKESVYIIATGIGSTILIKF